MEPTDRPRPAGPGVLGLLSEPLGVELVREQLPAVIEPELGVNVVDVGLIHAIAVDAGGLVTIELTLTTPGCPLGGFLADQTRACMASLPQVRDVRLALVWDPQWAPEAMSDAAKEYLGWR